MVTVAGEITTQAKFDYNTVIRQAISEYLVWMCTRCGFNRPLLPADSTLAAMPPDQRGKGLRNRTSKKKRPGGQ